MKIIAYSAIIAAGISLILAVISRLTLTPIEIMPRGIEARGLLTFANTCFLIAITAILFPSLKK